MPKQIILIPVFAIVFLMAWLQIKRRDTLISNKLLEEKDETMDNPMEQMWVTIPESKLKDKD